jgi:hypothetical protein
MPERLLKQFEKIILLFSFFILCAALYFIYDYHLSSAEKETVRTLDNALLLARNLLEEEKSHALSLSLILSQDQALLDAYRTKDRALLNRIIQKKIKRLEAQQGYAFEVQIHDPQIRGYLRSWDYNATGIPLTSFRDGIIRVKKTWKPLVSVEVGRRLNIKAISPLIENGHYEGSVEVIEGFSHLERKLAEEGYALFILLDKRYRDIATTLRDRPLLRNRYVLVNDAGDKNALTALRGSDLEALERYGYFSHAHTAFGYFQIRNLRDEGIGYFVIATEQPLAAPLKTYNQEGFNDTNDSREVIIR